MLISFLPGSSKNLQSGRQLRCSNVACAIRSDHSHSNMHIVSHHSLLLCQVLCKLWITTHFHARFWVVGAVLSGTVACIATRNRSSVLSVRRVLVRLARRQFMRGCTVDPSPSLASSVARASGLQPRGMCIGAVTRRRDLSSVKYVTKFSLKLTRWKSTRKSFTRLETTMYRSPFHPIPKFLFHPSSMYTSWISDIVFCIKIVYFVELLQEPWVNWKHVPMICAVVLVTVKLSNSLITSVLTFCFREREM